MSRNIIFVKLYHPELIYLSISKSVKKKRTQSFFTLLEIIDNIARNSFEIYKN